MKFLKELILFFMSIIAVCATEKISVVQDSELKTKTLANGFTIAIFKNSEPPQRCSMRLLVKAGSLFETEQERGLAHFIEHMAFNGTTHFPSGEMTEYFQRLGMAFGSDTNAHTSFNETVYKLELPEVSDKVLGESFLLLRDYADGMMFEQKFIDSERSVILAEMKSRDNANYRRAVREIGLVFDGTTFGKRMPIGIESVVKSANQKDFFKFYRENYRPDNMVLVVVGDVDSNKIFDFAEKYFADFKAPDAPVRKMELGRLSGENGGLNELLQIKIDAMGVPNLTCSSASLSMVSHVEGSLDSVENRFKHDRLNLLGYVLNARFQRIADAPKSKILSGGASYYDYCSKMLVFSASCEAPLGKYNDATTELFRQILSVDSISETEVENAKKKIFDILQTAINGKTTRKNRSLANEITSAYSDGYTFISPEEDMRLTQLAYKDFGAKEVVALLKEVAENSKISLFVSDSKVSSGAEMRKEILADYAKAQQTIYSADAFAVSGLIFTDFKGEGKIVKSVDVGKIGVKQIKFENGVALNLKKTDCAKDEVLIRVNIGNGILSVPVDKPELSIAASAIQLGGTKYQSSSEINGAINLMKMNVSAKIAGGSLVIDGSSNVRDSLSMIKFASTMVADAGFRDDSIENLRKYAESFYNAFDAEPTLRLSFLSSTILNGAIAKVPGTYENFKKLTMSEIANWLKPILQNDYLEISIVGDFDEDAVIDTVAKTFGAMPRRADKLTLSSKNFELLPAGTNLHETYKAASEPRSLACVIWNTSVGEDMKKMRTATILSAVLDDVLRKDVREGEGNVYSPFAYYRNFSYLNFMGFTSATSFVEPKYNKQLLKTLVECGEKLVGNVSEDEFERAKIPIIKSLKTAERNNRYWLFNVMANSQAYPILIEMAQNRIEFYNAVSVDDVRKMAKEIFSEKPITLTVSPE